ncbi:uncharacterized protein LOC122576880 isoform X2 [Bombus pyrosoma]|uniref:uncharacterized protein LOC122576880 isoform X2 n=1 Tax=Bombus pyrosoma TaxID=396416 RepID=UPI001CB9D280|nr:uncharacterized protein LOC122576880 isoform X2 [Bombus pyrosoma]
MKTEIRRPRMLDGTDSGAWKQLCHLADEPRTCASCLRPEISFLRGALGAYAPSDEMLGVRPPQDEDEEAGSPIYVAEGT